MRSITSIIAVLALAATDGTRDNQGVIALRSFANERWAVNNCFNGRCIVLDRF